MTARHGGVDLHIHTTHSDGGCSPCEVVRAAANVGLTGLSITDHDTVSALAVARPEALRLGIELITGCELTTQLDRREYHLLAYFFQDDDEDFVSTCRSLRAQREDRVVAMVGRLSELGLSVDLQAIQRAFPRATVGRKHLADWLVRSGQVPSRNLVFERYLGDEGIAQVPKPSLEVEDAIALIQRAGGVAALAHPPYDLREDTLKKFVDMDLKAIEVQGSAVTKARGKRLRNWAQQYELVPIGGSDFHANDRPGRWIGSVTTPSSSVERLRLLCG